MSIIKAGMLQEMKEHLWTYDTDKNSSYEDVKEAYNYMCEEINNPSDMFPNGIDYDALDEDGI